MDKMLVFKCLLLLFPAVIFLQSGLDKVFKHEENKNYIQAVFARTFLKPLSGLLFYLLLIIELITGTLAIAGMYMMFTEGNDTMGYYTFLLSVITLIGLLAGQRIARDYAGASGIMPYLIMATFALLIYSL